MKTYVPLITIGSQLDDTTREWDICIGDAGYGTVHADPEELKKEMFDNAFYFSDS